MSTVNEMRKTLQLVELKEFAEQHHLDPKSNEAVYLWISEGHAALFDRHFEGVHNDIEAHCLVRCNGKCKGNPLICKLRNEVHILMKDKRNW